MFTAYRIAYGLVLVVFLGNVVKTSQFATAPGYVSVLSVTAVASLCSLFILLLRFSQTRPAIFWGMVLTWEALFVWYAWFSPAAPFMLHELHTLDASAATREATNHHAEAATIFVVLFAWFLSLPMTRLFYKTSAAIRA
jgi:hypothetical protein